MDRLKTELALFRTLIGVNLSSAMEYRASFITQILGMLINNGIYFVFWLIFFDQFGAVRGYEIEQIYLLFAVATFGYGMAHMFAGNVGQALAYLIAQGRLDYYLVLPRPLLPHVIFSRMVVSTIGEIIFGVLAYSFTGRFHPVEIGLFLVCAALAGSIFVGFSVITGSLAFFMGNARYVSQQMTNALLTFALYPNTLFSGGVRVLLFTLLPAAFIAAVPVEIISTRNGRLLLWLFVAAIVVWLVAIAVFHLGLRRYESGSAINVNI